MSQNLVSLSFTPAQIAAIDKALDSLEASLAGLIALDAEERRSLMRMGAKSEPFCRQTISALVLNPQVVPPSLDVAGGQADLAAFDTLRPRFQRIHKLAERAEGTEAALGSDLMSLALEGYALLKVAGKNAGLEGLRKDLSGRFQRTAKAPAVELRKT